MLRAFWIVVLGAFTWPALAESPAPDGVQDADTVCATMFTYLAESARQYGMSGTYFDMAAIKAEYAYMARNPTEDRQLYSARVFDGAKVIRDGLARGTLTNQSVMATATSCNQRFAADPPGFPKLIDPSRTDPAHP